MRFTAESSDLVPHATFQRGRTAITTSVQGMEVRRVRRRNTRRSNIGTCHSFAGGAGLIPAPVVRRRPPADGRIHTLARRSLEALRDSRARRLEAPVVVRRQPPVVADTHRLARRRLEAHSGSGAKVHVALQRAEESDDSRGQRRRAAPRSWVPARSSLAGKPAEASTLRSCGRAVAQPHSLTTQATHQRCQPYSTTRYAYRSRN